MWDGVDAIAWRLLRHNHGRATDTPGLLRACADPDAAVAAEAVDDLDYTIYHQGGWICPTAPAALPFLVALAADPAVAVRVEIIELVARIAGEARTVRLDRVDDAWPAALASATAEILALLDDVDVSVRRAAAYLVGVGGLDATAAVPALWRRLAAEPDRVTRWDLVMSLGSAGADPADLRRLAGHDDLQVRLAAAHALSLGGHDSSPNLEFLQRAVSDRDAAAWSDTAWLGPGPAAIVAETGRLLRGDPELAAAYTIAIGRDGHLEHRIAALAEAADLLVTWRTLTDPLVPFLGERLGDTAAEARFRAAYLLACVEPHAYGARLAELAIDDTLWGSRDRTTAGDAAVWALARGRDLRAVPGLRERLLGGRLGFAPHAEYCCPGIPFRFDLPGIHEVVAALAPTPDLLDAVITAIDRAVVGPDPGIAAVLCDPLGTWGPDAAAAVPSLRRLLTDSPERWQAVAAATALGRIGPGAVPAADDIKALAATGAAEAAVAWWRITAEPRPALALLAADAPALRALARFGPLAASAADRVRASLHSADTWVQVEAAHALARITGDTEASVAVLTQVAAPLIEGAFMPVHQAALKYLADLRAPAHDLATAVLERTRRFRYTGSWRAFDEDQTACTAAHTILSGTTGAP